MTEESWKDKNRKVAKWLEEVGRHADPRLKGTTTNHYDEAKEGLEFWPSYASDNAAAMRLLHRMPSQIVKRGKYNKDMLETDTYYLGYYSRFLDPHWLIKVSNKSLKKALVELAVKLIEEGIDPKE